MVPKSIADMLTNVVFLMMKKAKFKSFCNITNRVQGQSKVISLLGSKQVFIERGEIITRKQWLHISRQSNINMVQKIDKEYRHFSVNRTTEKILSCFCTVKVFKKKNKTEISAKEQTSEVKRWLKI